MAIFTITKMGNMQNCNTNTNLLYLHKVAYWKGMDNFGYTAMSEGSDSEMDRGFKGSLEIQPTGNKNSIVSCASFEKDRFLSLVGEENSLRNEGRFLMPEDYLQEKNRFKVCLYNRIATTGTANGLLRNASGIHHICNGSVVVTDVLNSCLFVFGASGRIIKSIPMEKGVEPWTTAATPSGMFAVALSREKCIAVLSLDGVEKYRIGQDILTYPSGVIVDRRNRYIVTDIKQNKIHIFSENGELIRSIASDDQNISLKSPRHVALSHSGDIIVSDSGNHCIKIFDRQGTYVRTIGKYGSDDGDLKFPHGVCTDTNDNIIVADYFNNRVSMFSKHGKFVQHLVTAQDGLNRPQAIAIRNHSSHFVLFITYGDMKSNKIVAYKIVDSENEKEIAVCARL